jgi:hypothetical protein
MFWVIFDNSDPEQPILAQIGSFPSPKKHEYPQLHPRRHRHCSLFGDFSGFWPHFRLKRPNFALILAKMTALELIGITRLAFFHVRELGGG